MGSTLFLMSSAGVLVSSRSIFCRKISRICTTKRDAVRNNKSRRTTRSWDERTTKGNGWRVARFQWLWAFRQQHNTHKQSWWNWSLWKDIRGHLPCYWPEEAQGEKYRGRKSLLMYSSKSTELSIPADPSSSYTVLPGDDSVSLPVLAPAAWKPVWGQALWDERTRPWCTPLRSAAR